jgi:hypothetical protein
MAAFRITDQDPVYFDSLGAPCAGGSLSFFDTGTTTPKNVYGEAALTTNNGSVLTLDSSGRAAVDVWGSGIYRVVLANSLGTVIWTRDNVQVQGDTLPTPYTSGYFLTNNGTTTSWAAVRQVPDPTGSSGKFLTTDGTTTSWSTVTDAQTGLLKSQTVTAATTTTIDLSLGCSILLNQAVDITSLVFTNAPSSTATYFVTITRVKDATGTARAISNLSSIATWAGGTPSPTQTTGAIDEFHIKFFPGVVKGRGTAALNLS